MLQGAGDGVGERPFAFPNPVVGWLWIHDITKFDIVLMFLYIASQFVASWQMSRKSAGQQKMIAYIMPIIVGIFMFIGKWPAGLFIYWFTSNLWTIAQQYVAEKMMPVPVPAAASSAKDKTPAKAPPKAPAKTGRPGQAEGRVHTPARKTGGKTSGQKTGQQKGKQQVARANGRTVELAVQRALAELDFAPGELAEDQYEVTIVIPPEEGFMGVGAVDAVVEVALVGEDFDFYGPENDAHAGRIAAARSRG